MSETIEGGPVEITDGNFEDQVEANEGLVMVDFWAEWCGPCRMVGPVIDELAKDYEGRVMVGKVDVDENPATAEKFNVRSIPSILFFKNGELVDTVVGMLPKAGFEQKILEHM